VIYLCKTFQDLSNQELYDVLRLRSKVFVVEQNCPYQDLDHKDEDSLHLMAKINGSIVAYARILSLSKTTMSIGRIVVEKQHRGGNYGKKMINHAEQIISARGNISSIELAAQTYLNNYYSSLGYASYGQPYMWDGIEHIRMSKTI